MDFLSLLVLLLVGVGVVFALRHIKKHPTTCGGDCSHCISACSRKKQ